MRYVFILGRIPELSLLEIKAVCRTRNIVLSSLSYTSHLVLATTEKLLDCAALIHQLGGTIKIAEILDETLSGDIDEDKAALAHAISQNAGDSSLRMTFGLSAYSLTPHSRLTAKQLERLGLSVKKSLREAGHSARLIMPKKGEETLSSVAVEKQELLEKNGFEFLLLTDGKSTHVARTIVVQPFEEFSLRDWNRPAKSMDVGMLPPKLARMMVNLAELSPTQALLDPFCGLGTVLQEALLLGHTTLYGSDLSKENSAATDKNLSWIANENHLSLTGVQIKVQDARSLTKSYAPGSIHAIVTEPYLGPIVTKSGVKNLNSIMKELNSLYLAFFREAHTVLSRNGKIIIVFPVWIQRKEKTALPIIERLLALGYTMNIIGRSARGSILIAREGQHVARELFIFEKKAPRT